jgi:hypothetical protein
MLLRVVCTCSVALISSAVASFRNALSTAAAAFIFSFFTFLLLHSPSVLVSSPWSSFVLLRTHIWVLEQEAAHTGLGGLHEGQAKAPLLSFTLHEKNMLVDGL